MELGGLVFSRGGVGQDRKPYGPTRPYRVSPKLFAQNSVINHYFLPTERDLPVHGLTPQILGFDFGFVNASYSVAPFDSQFGQITAGQDLIVYSINGVSDAAPSQNVVPRLGVTIGVQGDPRYLINLQQTHDGNTWQWFNKDVTDREACGTAENPAMLKQGALVPAGDTLSCMVRNLNNTVLRVQVCLFASAFLRPQ